jgi:hypothetical protein
MVARRAAFVLYLGTLALLPWATWPRFPWLHEHAQWSDAVFALATLLWVLDRLRAGPLPRPRFVIDPPPCPSPHRGRATLLHVRPRLFHAGMALYLGAAAVSLALAEPRPESGPAKLLGLAMLVALALVTSDLAACPGATTAIARTVAGTSFAVAAAALAGVVLALLGRPTDLVGTYGDLVPGAYARAQAGFLHPNLLGSFCVFAAGVVAREDAARPRRLCRLALGALLLTVLLTFSRAVLGFGLAVLVGWADTPGRRRLAAAYAVAALTAILVLSTVHVSLDPTRPGQARLLENPSPRTQAFVSALATLRARPWLGAGPGASPATKDGQPFDAHCTPLNVAATLGLPALAGFALIPLALWRERRKPTDRATWGILAGLALDGLAQDVEDFRHVWVAFGLADAGRKTSWRSSRTRSNV